MNLILLGNLVIVKEILLVIGLVFMLPLFLIVFFQTLGWEEYKRRNPKWYLGVKIK